MPSATVRSPFVWHELMTTDTKAAADFYGKIVGWKTKAFPQDPSYMMLVAKGGPMAGLMVLPDEAKSMGSPPCWVIYIGTPDVDETSRMAAELGGKVLRKPADIPNVGRFSIIQDPQGAVFAAFTPLQSGMGGGKPTFGDFSWHELTTSDWQAAFDFYQKLFGWTKTNSLDMGPELGTYQMYGWKGVTLGGMWTDKKGMGGPPHWLAYIMVPDSKKAATAVKAAGGQVLNGPMEVPGGDWMAQCLDPQGVLFAVHSLKPVVAEPVAKKAAAKKKPAKAKKPAPKKKVAAKKVAAKKRPAKAKKAKKRVARKPARKARAAKRAPSRKKVVRPKARKKAGAKKRRR